MPTEAWGLGTFAHDGDRAFAGLVVGEAVVDLRPAFGDGVTTLSLIEDWDAAQDQLSQLAADGSAGAALALSDLRPLPPVASRQILCAGANYVRHVEDLAFLMLKRQDQEGKGDDELRAGAVGLAAMIGQGEPFIFAGLPSALSGAQDDIVLRGPGHEHDWELELAVVIGRGGTDIAVDRAMEHVAGYTISNDISTRDLLHRPGIPMSDLLMTKSRPTFFPTGPFLVPAAAVPDPSKLRLTLRVNGEVMQDDTPEDFIFGIDRLVAYASTVTTLLPGDLLLTGSPTGNAPVHGERWLRDGDVVESEITGLGRQRNRCVVPAS